MAVEINHEIAIATQLTQKSSTRFSTNEKQTKTNLTFNARCFSRFNSNAFRLE